MIARIAKKILTKQKGNKNEIDVTLVSVYLPGPGFEGRWMGYKV